MSNEQLSARCRLMKPLLLTFDDFGRRRPPKVQADKLHAIDLPLWSIGITNDYQDIASDYAWVLFAADRLAQHSEVIAHEHIVKGRKHFERIIFRPRNGQACRDLIARMKRMTSGDKAEVALGEEAVQFEQLLPSCSNVTLPLLGDSFMAHHVHSRETYFEGRELEDLYRSNPTWRYGFWRSFLSAKLATEAFSSLHSWILPRNFELRRLLQTLDPNASNNALTLTEARLLKLGQLPWTLTNEISYVRVPYNCLNAAADCWGHCLFSGTEVERRSRARLSALLSECATDLDLFERSEHPDYLTLTKHEWQLNADGSVVSVAFADAQIVAFLPPSSKIRPRELRKQLSAAQTSVKLLASGCGLNRENLEWGCVGADQFEHLCYDILLRCDRFDSSRMRKLGRTRSRDGGRDIEVWTRGTPGRPPQKWIYQCKYSSDHRRSISGSNVAITDVIDQYTADGFGIMTNVVIDATLYDKMDAIQTSRSKRGLTCEIDSWSVLEIERFLATNQDIAKRYFAV